VDSVVRDIDVIERLYTLILSRRGMDPSGSYTAKLFDKGRRRIAKKMAEEAAETVIAALVEGRQDLVAESADLIYHLLVLWADAGIVPGEVFAELARREGTSGVDEKKLRKKD